MDENHNDQQKKKEYIPPKVEVVEADGARFIDIICGRGH